VHRVDDRLVARAAAVVAGERQPDPGRVGAGLALLTFLVFGYWLQALDAWLTPRWRWRHRWAVVALPVLLFAGDALVVNRGHWPHNAFRHPLPARVDKDFVWLAGGGATSYRRLFNNEGSADCFEGVTIPRAKGLKLNSATFAWLADPAAGAVTLTTLSTA